MIVLLHGYGMRPETYLPMAQRLADRAEVVIPDLFDVPGLVGAASASLDCLELTLDEVGASAGQPARALVRRRASCWASPPAAPSAIVECVFGDTLGRQPARWVSPSEAVHPVGILRMATRPAASAFVRSWLTRPCRWRPRRCGRSSTTARPRSTRSRAPGCRVTCSGPRPTPCSRVPTAASSRGGCNADFTVAERPHGYGPIDHDWMFDDPELFAGHLAKLGLVAPAGDRANISP